MWEIRDWVESPQVASGSSFATGRGESDSVPPVLRGTGVPEGPETPTRWPSEPRDPLDLRRVPPRIGYLTHRSQTWTSVSSTNPVFVLQAFLTGPGTVGSLTGHFGSGLRVPRYRPVSRTGQGRPGGTSNRSPHPHLSRVHKETLPRKTHVHGDEELKAETPPPDPGVGERAVGVPVCTTRGFNRRWR